MRVLIIIAVFTVLSAVAIALASCSNNNKGDNAFAVLESSVGFDITDEQARKLYNIQIAENIKTAILSSTKIEDAQVVVNSGYASLEDDASSGRESSASVVLTLAENETLSNQEVLAIADYIRGSIPGIQYENITITDSDLNYYQVGDGPDASPELRDGMQKGGSVFIDDKGIAISHNALPMSDELRSYLDAKCTISIISGLMTAPKPPMLRIL